MINRGHLELATSSIVVFLGCTDSMASVSSACFAFKCVCSPVVFFYILLWAAINWTVSDCKLDSFGVLTPVHLIESVRNHNLRVKETAAACIANNCRGFSF